MSRGKYGEKTQQQLGGVLSAEECVVMSSLILRYKSLSFTSRPSFSSERMAGWGVSGFLAAAAGMACTIGARGQGGTKQRIKRRWEKFLRPRGSGERESARHIPDSGGKKTLVEF